MSDLEDQKEPVLRFPPLDDAPIRPRHGSRYFVYRHCATDLLLTPHLPRYACYCIDNFVTSYVVCSCTMCVFSYADIHTITTRLV